MIFTFLRRCAFVAALALLALCALPQLAAAGVYGRGDFGACSYKGCAVAAPVSTQSTLPSGLKIAVNLTDGQHIPKNGYTILVTPLNGAGSSFQKVDFYIDGNLVQTVLPDNTGTARWLWDPKSVPGTHIKIVVTATDGSTVAQQFTVLITTAETPLAAGRLQHGATGQQNSADANQGAVAQALQDVYEGAKRVVRALPKPVAYSFPYVLLGLLAANVLLLVWQAKRELREYHTLQSLLARERSAEAAKKTLLELVAHYLRTPLTVVLGGMDMLKAEGSIAAASLQQLSTRLRQTVEQVLAQTRVDSGQAVIDNGAGNGQCGSMAAARPFSAARPYCRHCNTLQLRGAQCRYAQYHTGQRRRAAGVVFAVSPGELSGTSPAPA